MEIDEREEVDEASEIKWTHAVLYFVVGSFVLLILYYYFQKVELILTLLISLSSLQALLYMGTSFLNKLPECLKCCSYKINCRCFGQQKVGEVLNLLVSVCIIVVWWITRVWWLNDLIAVALVMLIIKAI